MKEDDRRINMRMNKRDKEIRSVEIKRHNRENIKTYQNGDSAL